MHRGSNMLVALGEDLGAGRWSVRIQVRPLVNFIWLAAFIMAVGGAVALSDRRYRLDEGRGSLAREPPAGHGHGAARVKARFLIPSRGIRTAGGRVWPSVCSTRPTRASSSRR